MPVMKRKLAKFGVFQIHDTGADELYMSRDLKGKPLMNFADANELKQYLKDQIPVNNNLNLIVKKIS